MLLGAVIDSGLPVDVMRAELGKLAISGYSIDAHKAERGSIQGTQVHVNTVTQQNITYTINDFVNIVENSSLDNIVGNQAIQVLNRIAMAEAKVHGYDHPLEELGDIDTIIDVVGVCAGLSILGIDRLHCSPLPSGSGFIKTRHGTLPVPAPATMELIAMANAKIATPNDTYLNSGELVTPTGAALVTTLASFDSPLMEIESIGYGVGHKDMPTIPNLVSLWIGESNSYTNVTELSMLETNIDDMNPEILGYLREKLIELGALDAWFTSVHMKKGRPGTQLSMLCRPNNVPYFSKLIMRESSTLGIRIHSVNRYEADREIITIESSLGSVKVKLKSIDGSVVSVSPEYDDCKSIAEKSGMMLADVYLVVDKEAREFMGI